MRGVQLASGELIEDKKAIFVMNIADYLNSKNFSSVMSFLDNVEVEKGKGKKVTLLSEIEDAEVKKFVSDANEYVKEITANRYSQVIDVNFLSCTWVREPELVKWEPSSILAAHIDGDEKQAPPLITLGALIYLNDDYKGGELIFPEYDITIKPKFGDLVIFPCHYLHEVGILSSEDKYRYTLPLFYSFLYEENQDV